MRITYCVDAASSGLGDPKWAGHTHAPLGPSDAELYERCQALAPISTRHTAWEASRQSE